MHGFMVLFIPIYAVPFPCLRLIIHRLRDMQSQGCHSSCVFIHAPCYRFDLTERTELESRATDDALAQEPFCGSSEETRPALQALEAH